MLQQQHWSMTQCVNVAEDWCPELFGGLRPDTPRKWKVRQGVSTASGGRPKVLALWVEQKLAVLVHGLARQGVGLGAPAWKVLFEEALAADGQARGFG